MRNTELYLNGATVIYGLQPFTMRLPELRFKGICQEQSNKEHI